MKKTIIFLVFLILIINIFVNTVNAQASNYFIGDVDDSNLINTKANNLNINVDSSGNLYSIVGGISTNQTVLLFKSTDDGETWVKSELWNASNDNYPSETDWIDTYIDDDDVIHIATQGSEAGLTNNFNVTYRRYLTSTSTLTGDTLVASKSGAENPRGVAIAKNDYGEIAIAYAYTGYVKLKILDDQYGIWGDEQSIGSLSANYPMFLNMDCMSNTSFIVGFVKEDTYDRYYIKGFEELTDNVYTIVTSDAVSVGATSYGDFAIDSNDDIHLLFQYNNNGDYNYTFIDSSNSFSISYENIELTDAEMCEVLVNSDDTVQLLYSEDNTGTTSHWVMGYEGSYGDWSEQIVYNTPTTDEHTYMQTPYQNLQSFTKGVTGVVGMGFNYTDDSIYYFDNGFTIFYNASEEDTEYDECTGGSYTIQKLFDNSTCTTNETVLFKVIKANVYYSNVQIIDSSSNVIYEYPQTTIPVRLLQYTPKYEDGNGTFYIRARNYGSSTWDVTCPFYVDYDASMSDEYYIRIYINQLNGILLDYIVPDGGHGKIELKFGDEDYFTLGWFVDTNGLREGYETGYVAEEYDVVYCAKITNTSNTDEYYIDCYALSTPQFYYELLVNGDAFGDITTGVNDSVNIGYKINYLKDNLDVVVLTTKNDLTTIEEQYPITELGEFWKFKSDTVGTFYVQLLMDGILHPDGKYCKITVELTTPSPLDDSTWYGLPYWLPYLIGIFIILLITMSPLILGTYINRKTKMSDIHIPPMLYVGFFFMGLITTVLMGFIPSYIPFVILFAMIVYFAIQWLYGKKEVAGD